MPLGDYDVPPERCSMPSSARCRSVAPLDGFPDHMLAEIEYLVAQPKRPPRWLDLGLAQIESRAWWEWHWARGVDPDKRRSSLPPTLRERIIERDGLVCGICASDVASDDVHIDHIHPVAQGGSDDPANLRVTHSLCNMRKGASIQ